MTRFNSPDEAGPTPEQWLVFLDGLLADADRRRIESWLANRPGAAAEAEAQRRLIRLWHEAAPPEPAEAEWDAVLARVQTELEAPRPRRFDWLGWTAVGAMAAVAASLLAVILTRPPASPPLPAEVFAAPYTIIPDRELEIISMRPQDTGVLLAGRPPEVTPLVLVAREDLRLNSVELADNGRLPRLYLDEETAAPMIVVPLGPEAEAPAP